eukprot:jgi/Hompol1/4473/HPOL_001732-RA
MRCAENLPVLATDVLNRILELLKLYNSRTCQVILGAGAMRSAGLKNITARHIALAAQSIGVVLAILPYLKDGISRLLPQKQQVLLGDFDRIIRDFREHQNELYMNCFPIAQAISWDNPDPKEFSAEESVTVHMAVLVKETTTLHKVLSKYLPAEALRRMEEDFRKIELYSSAGKNRLLMDVQYFTRQLSSLDGVDGPGSHLEVCVNNIKIKDRRAASATPTGTTLLPGSNNRSGATLGPSATSSQSQPVSPGRSPLGQTGGLPPVAQPGSSTTATTPAGRATSQFATAFGKMLRSQNDSHQQQ